MVKEQNLKNKNASNCLDDTSSNKNSTWNGQAMVKRK